MLIVHTCQRCAGSGYVVGRSGWEIPWSRWAALPQGQECAALPPRVCGDCGGSGALLEMPAVSDPFAGLPYRLARFDYQRHVTQLLRKRH